LNKFHDVTLQDIYDYQDQRLTDSLLVYLNHENQSYQVEAAKAFASVQDSMVSAQLVSKLSNSNSNELNAALALALGQIGDKEQAGRMLLAFTQLDSMPSKVSVLRSIGRCLNEEYVDQYAQMSISINEELQEAHAWGIYRSGVNGFGQPSLIQKALQYLGSTNSDYTRLGAAHYLSRTRDIDLSKFENEILNSAQGDSNPEVRMASALAMRKIKSTTVNNHLLDMLQSETDYRVLISILRSLQETHQSKNTPIVMELLNHDNPNVSVQAATYLKANANGFYLDQLVEQVDTISNKRVKATLVSLLADKIDSDQIKQYVSDEENPYAKASFLSAMSGNIEYFDFVKEQMVSNDSHSAVSSSAASTLVELRKLDGISSSQKEALLETFKSGIKTGDVAIVGTFAAALVDDKLEFKKEIDDVGFLKEALTVLQMPRDIETVIEVQKAIDYFEGSESVAPVAEFQHPIDWDYIKTINDNQQVLLKTNKGEITMEFYVEESPGSVAAILKLIEDGYYDGKTFHRVVPNFVAQGGCPRGDGWGSLDYTIRSEFTNRGYKTGTVGLASSGKDTESCQWFITHSPTPHLDGRYSIIADVIDGMDIVHQLEVGDIIESMTKK